LLVTDFIPAPGKAAPGVTTQLARKHLSRGMVPKSPGLDFPVPGTLRTHPVRPGDRGSGIAFRRGDVRPYPPGPIGADDASGGRSLPRTRRVRVHPTASVCRHGRRPTSSWA
jgi:hypothetical protein